MKPVEAAAFFFWILGLFSFLLTRTLIAPIVFSILGAGILLIAETSKAQGGMSVSGGD